MTAAETRDPLRLERDLFLRLLELGEKDEVGPFLAEVLALTQTLAGAAKAYVEIDAPEAPSRRAAWLARGFSDGELTAVRRHVSSGIIAEALATGRTIATASAIDDPRFRDQTSVRLGNIQAVMCAPLGGAKSRGVLYLEGRGTPGPFSEEDRARVELVARHSGPAIDRLLLKMAAESAVDATRDVRARFPAESIVGTSPALAHLFQELLAAAPLSIAVLLTGETGSGKSAVARSLHAASSRSRGPFVEVNCAAIPETLFESELFGAERGAHSTATRRVDGKIDAARTGTLFLDEVGELPLSVQPKLLTFLQRRKYFRLGGAKEEEADVRVVAATNRDLEERVREKAFREDLFYRLGVLMVRVPSLRERREDVPAIADHAARAIGTDEGAVLPLTSAARIALEEAEWPGNVRQLENAVQRGYARARAAGASAIGPEHLFNRRPPADAAAGDATTYQDAMRAFQARFLRESLEATGWNVSECARRVDVARSRLHELLRVHGLVRPPGASGDFGR